jgi:hypothetical protein
MALFDIEKITKFSIDGPISKSELVEVIKKLDDDCEIVAGGEPFMSWSSDVPTEGGYYHHWTGSDDDASTILIVQKSGTNNKCFIEPGQYGLKQSIWCDEHGGYWIQVNMPTTSACQ